MTPNGSPKRLDTFIDIPLDIGLPHFVSDDKMDEEGPLFGNFKLVLQSVICHRGVSVDSGHYIALIRANEHKRPSTSRSDNDQVFDTWLRFDDLAKPRVMEIDIKQALREESPYLLFYQVQPIDEELARGDPPAYKESESGLLSVDPSKETLVSGNATDTETGEWDKVTSTIAHPESVTSGLVSRTSMSSNRRSSIAFDDLEGSLHNVARGRTQPSTPDEFKTGFLSASRRGSRIWPAANKSRTSSPSGEGRLSLTLSRLTGRGSKDKLVITENAVSDEPVIVVDKVSSGESIQQTAQSPAKEKTDPGLTRSKSKKEKDKKDKRRSKSREPSEALGKGKSKDKEKSRPDRECTVM